MPTTHEVITYQFNELSPDAQEKALDNMRDINIDYADWHECVIDEWEETLGTMGVYDVTISYSGFWSQGDGASFVGRVDLAAWLKSQKLANTYRALYNAAKAHDVDARIVRGSHHYVHEYTISADIQVNNYTFSKHVDAQADDVTDLLTEWARDQSRRIYESLRDEYEYLTSDEVVKETIEANEYEFTKSGTLY